MLYELHGYRTETYDRKSDRRTLLKDSGLALSKIENWIEQFLADFPDGKVVVSRVVRQKAGWSRRGWKKEKAFVQTISGKEYTR